MVQATSEKISEMDAITALSSAAVIPVTDGNASYKVTKPNLLGYLDVRDYGASTTATGAANVTALTAAVAAAVAAGAGLWWPAGSYTTTATIPLLHTVRHRGPGAIVRGSDTFYVEPRYGQTNRLYVATAGGGGTAANDGLSSSQPILTPGTAFSSLRNYGPLLNGSWVIKVAAGTYSVNTQTFDTPSRDWVTIQGPDVSGSPNVPTAILDGTGAGSNNHGFVVNGQGVQLWCQDIKFQNYNAGTQNSCGVAVGYAARFYAKNVHATNCDFAGVLADQGDILLVGGGIYDACRSGIVSNATRSTIGYGAVSVATGTTIQNCTQNGIYWSRGSQGHIDYCLHVNNPYHVVIESASRAHLLGNDFRTATTAAITTNTDGSYYDDVSVVNVYNDGTGTANAKRYDHFAFTGEQQTWMQTSRSEVRRYFDDTTRTLTSAVKAQIGADVLTLPANYFVSTGTKIRIKVWGDTPADTLSLGINFFAATGSVTTVMDYSASTGTPGAVGFEYECTIFTSSVTSQRSFGNFAISNLGTRLQNTGNAANMALAQTIRLMAQSATGTVTVRRVEVWVLG